MSWFRKQRPTTAEALELELAGVATGSAAAELLPVAEALRRTGSSLPAPTQLQARRQELLRVGTAAAAAHGRRRRVVRPVLLAAVIAILLAAAALGAAMVSSWLQAGPRLPAGHEPSGRAPTSQSEHAASLVGYGSDPAGAGESAPSSSPGPEAQRPSTLNANCGDDSAATALLAVLAAECQAALASVVPTASPLSELDELAVELLAILIAACGEDAIVPDLTGLDDGAATALIEALAGECEAALASVVPTASPLSELDELAAELLAILIAACGEDATLPDLTGLDDSAATALVAAVAAECQAALTLP